MAKEAYYFSHDCNAQDDPKIMHLIGTFKFEGYGIYWALIEKLRQDENYKLPISTLPFLAKRWGISLDKLKSIINDFSLFSSDETLFWSESLCRRMLLRSEKGKKGANARWKKEEEVRLHMLKNANASPSNALKESKGKESKGKEIEPNGSHAPAHGESADLKKTYKQVFKDKTNLINFIRTHKPDFYEPYFDLWNVFALEYKRPTMKELTDSRKKKLGIRLKDAQFDFVSILAKAAKSEFCLTGNFFAFDWLVENEKNYLKVLEGNYDNKENQQAPANTDDYLEQRKKIEERTRKLSE